MKSPDDLASALVRQWNNATQRAQRLLGRGEWPIELPIGQPTPSQLTNETAKVREHIARWRAVKTGRVEWADVVFRSAAESVSVPRLWRLSSPEEWAEATGDEMVHLELLRLRSLLERVDTGFHAVLVRQRGLWRGREDEEVVLAARLAEMLAPGIAEGGPLRAVAKAGIDSKFMERNEALVTALLDTRFNGEVSEQGLTTFLGAADEGDHWLLVAPLAPGILPFTQLRVRARELMTTKLPAKQILVVENERCLYRLPELPDTVAVLGAGLDLGWLRADWLRDCRLGYWGDMDTWGLRMLANARKEQPHLESLLMSQELFEQHAAELAVQEPVTAGEHAPEGLSQSEHSFYGYLLGLQRGRIEQEFLPLRDVASALSGWKKSSPTADPANT